MIDEVSAFVFHSSHTEVGSVANATQRSITILA